ncbi:hypothetical protein [Streptomyces niveus]|uniref:hypothetical protein n=1 Tax=Streptomyces niveus TaxID=193462 RepID=UPI003438EB17
MNLASPPPRDFGPQGDFDPNPQAGQLLEYIAWSVTAAAVAGVMFIGVQMAMQLRAGEMGAGTAHFRGLVFVMLACILCLSAGPLVEFIVQPYLLAP